MYGYPKWLLALAAVCLLPTLLSPFYIFVFPAEATLHSVSQYLLRQALWIVPAFFARKGLDYYYREFNRLGVATIAIGIVIAIAGALAVFL